MSLFSLTPLTVLDDPRLTAFYPLLYVAWADGDLSPEEIRAICSRVSATPGSERGCRDYLGGWLDPDDPPSARDLRAAEDHHRQAYQHHVDRCRHSSADHKHGQRLGDQSRFLLAPDLDRHLGRDQDPTGTLLGDAEDLRP